MLFLAEEMGADFTQYRKALLLNGKLEGCLYHKIVFSSQRKRMSVVLRGKEFCENSGIKLNDSHYVLSKGASEMMFDKCNKYINEQGQAVPITEDFK